MKTVLILIGLATVISTLTGCDPGENLFSKSNVVLEPINFQLTAKGGPQ